MQVVKRKEILWDPFLMSSPAFLTRRLSASGAHAVLGCGLLGQVG